MAHARNHNQAAMDDAVQPPERVPQPRFENFCVCGRPAWVGYDRWVRTGTGTGHWAPTFYASKWSGAPAKKCPGCGVEWSRRTVFTELQQERRKAAAMLAGNEVSGGFVSRGELLEGCRYRGSTRAVLMAMVIVVAPDNAWAPAPVREIAQAAGVGVRAAQAALALLVKEGRLERRAARVGSGRPDEWRLCLNQEEKNNG